MSFWKKVEEIGKKATEVAAELGSEGQKRLTEYQQKAEEQRKVTEAELAARRTEQDALLTQHVPGVVKFNVAANYHGGYPGFPDIIDGGHLYLSQDELVWLKLPTVVRIPYTDIYDLDLDNFKVSMMRSFLAGGSDNDVHRLKNTLVVICRINGVKQRVKFEIWGGLSVHAGALNAQKTVDHMAEVRHLFAQEGSGNLTLIGCRAVTDRKPYRHRFPLSVIGYALRLYHRFPLSQRDVQELLHERGVQVSHEGSGNLT